MKNGFSGGDRSRSSTNALAGVDLVHAHALLVRDGGVGEHEDQDHGDGADRTSHGRLLGRIVTRWLSVILRPAGSRKVSVSCVGSGRPRRRWRRARRVSLTGTVRFVWARSRTRLRPIRKPRALESAELPLRRGRPVVHLGRDVGVEGLELGTVDRVVLLLPLAGRALVVHELLARIVGRRSSRARSTGRRSPWPPGSSCLPRRPRRVRSRRRRTPRSGTRRPDGRRSRRRRRPRRAGNTSRRAAPCRTRAGLSGSRSSPSSRGSRSSSRSARARSSRRRRRRRAAASSNRPGPACSRSSPRRRPSCTGRPACRSGTAAGGTAPAAPTPAAARLRPAQASRPPPRRSPAGGSGASPPGAAPPARTRRRSSWGPPPPGGGRGARGGRRLPRG